MVNSSPDILASINKNIKIPSGLGITNENAGIKSLILVARISSFGAHLSLMFKVRILMSKCT